jgi:hypothetical protein
MSSYLCNWSTLNPNCNVWPRCCGRFTLCNRMGCFEHLYCSKSLVLLKVIAAELIHLRLYKVIFGIDMRKSFLRKQA